MKKQGRDRRADRRVMNSETLVGRQWEKFLTRLDRAEDSEANVVFFVDGDWVRISGAGLIHNGRKPR